MATASNDDKMLRINAQLSIRLSEIEFKAVRSKGPGGQHVNKVNTAVQLRFDISKSSLPDWIKNRLLALSDKRLSRDGVLTIKGQGGRSQLRNKEQALERLSGLIETAAKVQKARKPTKPSYSARQKRMDYKSKRSKTKFLRGRVKDFD